MDNLELTTIPTESIYLVTEKEEHLPSKNSPLYECQALVQFPI
ncbi:hypothetical protein [Lederbergia lenta]|nr:hypothetical protein [Lederbergia lenta]